MGIKERGAGCACSGSGVLMAYQRITLKDKVVERVLNASLKELYTMLEFTTALNTFKADYLAAATDAARLDVVARYLKLK